MKKRMNSAVMILAVVCLAMLFSQCRSKQAAMPSGETRVEVLCSGSEYFTSTEYFRANSMGESSNMTNSKRMALSNARADLASHIGVLVSGVVDNYYQQAGVEDRSEYAERYEGMFREIVNERLAGTRVICEEVTRTPEGRYRTYIAIELAGNEILNAANQRISRDERLRLDYNYERFKNTFDDEIEKYRRSQGY